MGLPHKILILTRAHSKEQALFMAENWAAEKGEVFTDPPAEIVNEKLVAKKSGSQPTVILTGEWDPALHQKGVPQNLLARLASNGRTLNICLIYISCGGVYDIPPKIRQQFDSIRYFG